MMVYWTLYISSHSIATHISSHSSCTVHYQPLGTHSKTFAVTAHALYISGHSARAVNFQSLSRHRAYPAIQHALHIFTHSAGAVQHCYSLNTVQNTSHSSCIVHLQPLRMPHNFRHWTRNVQHFQSLSTRRATLPVIEHVLNKCFSLCIVLANFHQYIKDLHAYVPSIAMVITVFPSIQPIWRIKSRVHWMCMYKLRGIGPDCNNDEGISNWSTAT